MRSYEHRTPLAWRHRDMHHHHHHHHPRHHHHHRSRHPPSLSPSSSSSSDDEEVPMVRPPRPGSRSQFSAAEHFRAGGTLRSTRSVPALALATWDGEPCPVHGHGMPHPPLFHPSGTMRRHGSLFDVRAGPLVGGPPPLMDKKAFHGSMQFPPWMGGPPPPPAPVMRPPLRPFVIPAGAEPLPVRDPYRRFATTGPHKEMAAHYDMSDQGVCCKGHLIVLWIILAVVTVGVILGIVLGVTIA